MDRLLREGNPPTGQLASPKPQYKKPGVDEYAPVEGQHGAPFATLKDASGNVVSPATEAKLEQVRALLSGVATEAKLEQARVLLNSINSKDFATASKQDALNTVVEDLKSELALVKAELQAIKANQLSGDQIVQLASPIPQYKRPGSTDYEAVEGQHGAPFATLKDASGNIISPATEDKLEQVRQLLTGVATEDKLEQARALLQTISGKDFATQTTLAQVKSELELVKAELQAIKANQLSGDQIVQLSGTMTERYGADVNSRPPADTVLAGTTFTIVDESGYFQTWISDGTKWVEV